MDFEVLHFYYLQFDIICQTIVCLDSYIVIIGDFARLIKQLKPAGFVKNGRFEESSTAPAVRTCRDGREHDGKGQRTEKDDLEFRRGGIPGVNLFLAKFGGIC